MEKMTTIYNHLQRIKIVESDLKHHSLIIILFIFIIITVVSL